MNILLAEDNPINQKVAVRLLEKRGHTVVVAETGKRALEMLESRAALRPRPDGCANARDGRLAGHGCHSPTRDDQWKAHSHHCHDCARHGQATRNDVCRREWMTTSQSPCTSMSFLRLSNIFRRSMESPTNQRQSLSDSGQTIFNQTLLF